MKFQAYRIIGSKPGCVDYLGEFSGTKSEVQALCESTFDLEAEDYIELHSEDTK